MPVSCIYSEWLLSICNSNSAHHHTNRNICNAVAVQIIFTWMPAYLRCLLLSLTSVIYNCNSRYSVLSASNCQRMYRKPISQHSVRVEAIDWESSSSGSNSIRYTGSTHYSPERLGNKIKQLYAQQQWLTSHTEIETVARDAFVYTEKLCTKRTDLCSVIVHVIRPTLILRACKAATKQKHLGKRRTIIWNANVCKDNTRDFAAKQTNKNWPRCKRKLSVLKTFLLLSWKTFVRRVGLI